MNFFENERTHVSMLKDLDVLSGELCAITWVCFVTLAVQFGSANQKYMFVQDGEVESLEHGENNNNGVEMANVKGEKVGHGDTMIGGFKPQKNFAVFPSLWVVKMFLCRILVHELLFSNENKMVFRHRPPQESVGHMLYTKFLII